MTKKQKPIDIEQPCASQHEMFRMSENGSGFIQWGHQTHHDWETVIAPGYFRAAKIKTGLNTYDRIEVTAGALLGHGCFGTLVVTGVSLDGNITIAVMVGPISAAISTDNPFDVLGLHRSANLDEVELAFRTLSKEMHPDVGGDKEAFERLVWARTECRLSCEKRAA